METEQPIQDRDNGRHQRELRLEVSGPAAPVDSGIERKERALVEVAGHGRRIELPPRVRVEERGGDVIEPEGGAQREDAEERVVADRTVRVRPERHLLA